MAWITPDGSHDKDIAIYLDMEELKVHLASTQARSALGRGTRPCPCRACTSPLGRNAQAEKAKKRTLDMSAEKTVKRTVRSRPLQPWEKTSFFVPLELEPKESLTQPPSALEES